MASTAMLNASPLSFSSMRPNLTNSGNSRPEFVKLGRIDENDNGEAFNMAVLAMENADYVNGVSKLHAKVTRGMFSPRWPGYPEDEIPIQAITNGVHTATWVNRRMTMLFDRY